MKKALIIVDMQNDFCSTGSLPVKDGEKIVGEINRYMVMNKYDLIVATKDWHPKEHKSFASNNNKNFGEVINLNGITQVMWTDHCVQDTEGSEFHPKLDLEKINHIIYKGTNIEIDSYSGFFDNDKKSDTGLNQLLKDNGITNVDVCGLALDYCVKATAIDSQTLGYETTVLIDATKAVHLNPTDGEQAIEEMKKVGIKIDKTRWSQSAMVIGHVNDFHEMYKIMLKNKLVMFYEKENNSIYVDYNKNDLSSLKLMKNEVQHEILQVSIKWRESDDREISKLLLAKGFGFKYLGDDGSWVGTPYYLMFSKRTKPLILEYAKKGFFSGLANNLWKFEL
jgi:nicotinamidase/pyrazinamidase